MCSSERSVTANMIEGGGSVHAKDGPLAARSIGSYDGGFSRAGSTAWGTFKLAYKLLLATPTVLRRSSVAAG